jgi:putative molybdopterin biosynthesis protein
MIGEAIRRRREALHWSLSELARRAGLSRQALLAVEQGAVPRVDTAVRIAEALGTTVEDLLHDADRSPVWVGPPAPYARWARVGGWLVLFSWGDWEADVEVAGPRLSPLPGARDPDRVLVVAGCDPALPALARRLEEDLPGWQILPWAAPSRTALELLQQGWVHVAGIHLHHASGYNRPHAEALGIPLVGVRAVTWRSGIAAQAPDDLSDWPRWWEAGQVALREDGSEARALLDRTVSREGLPAPRTTPVVVAGHAQAARAVASGTVRAAVMPESAAALLGLPFAAWAEEPFDWVVRTPEDPAVALEVLARPATRRWLGRIPGYDAEHTGQVVWEVRPPGSGR